MSEKTLNDNLYGRISVSEFEAKLLGTQAFLRLGRISQLGLAPMVFSGATHTRFSHSLGVMHVTGRVAQTLDLSELEVKTLRAAGLLHDIGQYPLSHCIEYVYRLIADAAIQGALVIDAEPPTRVTPPGSELQRVGTRLSRGRDADDKHMGAALLQRRTDLRNAFAGQGRGGVDVDEVASIVEGNPQNPLYQAILNSDYDCDRLDYVQRDSLMTGVPYGKVDLDYLIENMVARPFPSSGTDLVLAIRRRKGLGALEHYVLSRYYMYSQVYCHKTVRSFELLAKGIFLHFAQNGHAFPNHTAILTATDSDFVEFHDGYFYDQLRAYTQSRTPEDPVRQWIERLTHRQPLPMVYEHRELASENVASEHRRVSSLLAQPAVLADIATQAGVDVNDIVIDLVPGIELVPLRNDMLTFSQVLGLVEKVRTDPTQSGPTLNAPWVYDDQSDRLSLLAEDSGSILRPLVDMGIYLLRVYTTRDEHAPALALAIRGVLGA
jgi:uncharacterized protein